MSEQIILEPHLYAQLFPPMGSDEFEALKAGIARNGLQNPITLHQGRILDGWNRYRDCLELGISPVFVEYEGDDPLGFVVSMNLNRRPLTLSQRAVIAVRWADSKPGGGRTKQQIYGLNHAHCSSHRIRWGARETSTQG